MFDSLPLLQIYLKGVIVLIGAIIANSIAKFLGLPSWYDFISDPTFNVQSVIWLFIVYPLILGALTYLAAKI